MNGITALISTTEVLDDSIAIVFKDSNCIFTRTQKRKRKSHLHDITLLFQKRMMLFRTFEFVLGKTKHLILKGLTFTGTEF